jgi:putative SOS response-associated peptidase YedK
MCNDYEQHVRWADYRKMMQALDLAIPSHQSELDLLQADDIRINDMGPVLRAAGNRIELVPMTFAFPPARPGGAPVFNFRSEGRHFTNSNRCLIPASAFFEFTGKKYPKARHRFALKGSPITATLAYRKRRSATTRDFHDADDGARTGHRPAAKVINSHRHLEPRWRHRARQATSAILA